MAQNIALRYERFVSGYSNFFNHETDIDLTARTVGLNFKDVPDSMLVFALISFCETVRNIMYSNFDHGRRTWLYIEEMESLFKYPSVLNYFRRFANECRKFGMYLTGITQSTESMIRNQDANAIVKNSDFIMLLKQSKEDRDYWRMRLACPRSRSPASTRAPPAVGAFSYSGRPACRSRASSRPITTSTSCSPRTERVGREEGARGTRCGKARRYGRECRPAGRVPPPQARTRSQEEAQRAEAGF